MQHDQIKEEIVKQQGLSLLIRCATEPELIKQGETNKWSLEILLALTIQWTSVKKYQKLPFGLIEHLRTLLESTDDDEKRLAEGILWKLQHDKKNVGSTIVASNDPWAFCLGWSVPLGSQNLIAKLFDIKCIFYRIRKLYHQKILKKNALPSSHKKRNMHMYIYMNDTWKQRRKEKDIIADNILSQPNTIINKEARTLWSRTLAWSIWHNAQLLA